MKLVSKKVSSILLVSLFSLSSLSIEGCVSKAKNKNALVYGKSKDAVTLDPADITEGESATVSQNIFETLVKYKDEQTEVEPALAESWETTSDGLTWTFKLKKGVKFHDGTEFNAEAVKFNYDRQKDHDNEYRFNGKFEYWNLFFTNVQSIEAKDNLTVVFKLKEKDPIFLPNLALFTMGIASPTAIKKYGKDTFKNPIGTGPFKFGSWTQEERILLRANDEYWGEKAKIKKLIFKPVKDNAVRLLELEKGGVLGMDGVNPDDVARIEKNPNLKVIRQPGMNIGYMAMNTEKPPLDNLKVRLAINHAVNKDALVKAFFAEGKIGMVAKNPIPPTLWSYNDKIEDHKYDKELAKKLIKESGVDLSKTIKLWAMPIPRPYMPQPQKIAESIQADLKEIGLKTEIVSYDWGTYLDKASKGEHELALLGWIGDNGDPDNFLYTLLSSRNTKKGSASNYAFYKSAEMDKYLDDAKKEMNKEKRTDLYMKAQEVFHNEVPWLPLFHATQVAAFRKDIMGYKLHPTGAKLFKTTYFDKK